MALAGLASFAVGAVAPGDQQAEGTALLQTAELLALGRRRGALNSAQLAPPDAEREIFTRPRYPSIADYHRKLFAQPAAKVGAQDAQPREGGHDTNKDATAAREAALVARETELAKREAALAAREAQPDVASKEAAEPQLAMPVDTTVAQPAAPAVEAAAAAARTGSEASVPTLEQSDGAVGAEQGVGGTERSAALDPFAAADADHDGLIDRVQYEQALRGGQASLREAMVASYFERLDEAHDGVLDLGEFGRALGGGGSGGGGAPAQAQSSAAEGTAAASSGGDTALLQLGMEVGSAAARALNKRELRPPPARVHAGVASSRGARGVAELEAGEAEAGLERREEEVYQAMLPALRHAQAQAHLSPGEARPAEAAGEGAASQFPFADRVIVGSGTGSGGGGDRSQFPFSESLRPYASHVRNEPMPAARVVPDAPSAAASAGAGAAAQPAAAAAAAAVEEAVPSARAQQHDPAAALEATGGKDARTAALEHFAAADADHDGLIDRAQYEQALRGGQASLREAMVASYFERLDGDGDDVLSLREFGRAFGLATHPREAAAPKDDGH